MLVVIEDGSDNDCNDETEAGVASSDLIACSEDQDASDKSTVDKTRLSDDTPLRERAGGSCDRGRVCDIENELRRTVGAPPIPEGHQQSAKLYHKGHEDDDEDEDVRPPRQRKRRSIESDGATETATLKNAHTRSSAIGLAQIGTTPSTVSRSSSADAESIRSADYQEYPFQGIFKRLRIGQETTYNLEFTILDLPDLFRPSIDL